MTHSSNIPVSNALESAFAKARTEGGIRYLQVVIEDESLNLIGSRNLSSNLQADFETIVNLFEPKSPSYVIFRLDSQNMTGYEWLLVSWVPDGSSVKNRMLYASTRDSLKKQLGKPYFVSNDLFGSEKSEFSWAAYQDTLSKPASSTALTASEMQYHHEATLEIDPGHTREYVHGVRFPLSAAAHDALNQFSMRQNFVQLSVDATTETIELVSAKKITVNDLSNEISSTEPRFTFFKYTHTFSGESIDSNVFVYSCPENAPVKQKMLYSTVKSVVAEAAENSRIILEKNGKLEVDDPSEITVQALNESLHPKAEEKKGFARPLRPGKGGARLLRTKGT